MRLPQTDAPLFFRLTPTLKFVNLNQFAYPALQVASVLNRATELPIIQSTSAAQPVWAATTIGGTYFSTNFPGSTGEPGLTYSGAQYLEYDTLATYFSGTEVSFAFVAQVACASAGGTIFSFGSTSGTTPRITLAYSGGTMTLTEVSSAGTATTSATVDTALHVVSAVRTGTTLTLRVDAVTVGTPATITSASETFNTFVVGALNNNGSVSSQFNGTMGSVLVYGATSAASPDILAVENFLMFGCGLTRNLPIAL